ncbi:hypothetical protein GCM10020001_118000 [Nonomuraea salmonea]
MPGAGRPIGAHVPTSCPARTSKVQHPTTASVGPYSLTTTDSGARASQARTSAPASGSPPTTQWRAPAATFPGSWRSSGRCPGTTLASPNPPPCSRTSAASPSAPPATLRRTPAPAASGTHTLVTVRSNASDECTGAPPATSYVSADQAT